MLNPLKLLKAAKVADEAQTEINTMNKTNWKTNTAGIISCLFALVLLFAPQQQVAKIMSAQQQVGTICTLLGITGFVAKDHSN